jgi:hypothetical protein
VARETVDINEMLGKRATIAIDPEETAAEHDARLRREEREAIFELVKGYVVFFVIVVAIVLIGLLCAYEAVFDSGATTEVKRIAWTILSALFTGSVSFVLGQKSARAK